MTDAPTACPMSARKNYRFWFHFNKPASKSAGRPVWSFHYRGTCYVVNDVQVKGIDLETKSNKKQPHAVVRGISNHVKIQSYASGRTKICARNL